MIKLAKLQVPVVAVWFDDDSIQTHGTKHLKDFINNANQEELVKAMKEDLLKFSDAENAEPLIQFDTSSVNEKQKAKQILKDFLQEKTIEKLPVPLSCMGKKEKITWLTKQILRDQRLQSGSMLNYVKYGDRELMPSFWLNDEWRWEDLKKNLSNIKNEMYTGPGTFQDFLTRTIRNCLALNGKDPETYAFEFPGKSKSQKDQQRLKILLQNETSNEPIERDAIDIDVNENDAAEALAPEANYIPQSTDEVFTPRRRMSKDDVARIANAAAISSQDFDVFTEPTLQVSDYEPLYCNRPISIPPRFLQEINEPLHPGWKILKNTGGGACLFKAGADHIFLKDFTHLRKYVHAHMIKNWDFYRSFYVFPLTIKIGSGELFNEKNIAHEEDYLEFLKSKESMTSYNTSDAEVVAMGNVLNRDEQNQKWTTTTQSTCEE